MSDQRFVIYRRVSTMRQGISGLGLEGQEAAVSLFLRSRTGRVVAEFVEVESGKRSDRPKLAEALLASRRFNATLVVAKLDRLARNVLFISKLIESGVDFVACDNPHATKLTLHILSAMAEFEAEQISKRTRAALMAAKARGVLLGAANPRVREAAMANLRMANAKANRTSAEVRSKAADAFAESLMPAITEIQRGGNTSLRAIAAALNDMGIRTSRGCAWHAQSIRRVMERVS